MSNSNSNSIINTCSILLLLLSLSSTDATVTQHGSLFKCDSADECKGDNILCYDEADCSIECTNWYSCQNAKMTGPLSEIATRRLTVECWQCRGATITMPANSELYIECKYDEACAGITINAENAAYLDILVQGDVHRLFATTVNNYASATIYCPVSQPPGSCSITASAMTSDPIETNIFRGLRIYAVNGFDDVVITCSGTQSVNECFDASDALNTPILLCGSIYEYGCFTEPTTIGGNSATNWDCNEGTHMTHDVLCAGDNGLLPGIHGNEFICDEQKECMDLVFHCNDNEDCILKCSYHQSCNSATIYGPQNADLEVFCASAVEGNNQRICEFVNIYGPTNGSLGFVCNDTLSPSVTTNNCQSMNINASFAKHLDIQVKTGIFGIDVMAASSVYCPDPVINNSCLIHASGAGSNMLDTIQIYASNAFSSLSLTCDYAISVASNCYTSEPTLWCKSDASANCSLALVTGINQWECLGGKDWNVLCLPTSEPTHNPSSAPITNNPTNDPTMIPTSDPTINPTTDPTMNPTSDPTMIPTSDPTVLPTVNPKIPSAIATGEPLYRTVINITLFINGSLSSDEVINTVISYLIAKDINYPLNTDIIQKGGILIAVFQVSNALDVDVINSEEMGDILDKEYDGNVKVKNIKVDTNLDDNDDKESKSNANRLWLIGSVSVLLCFFCVFLLFWMRRRVKQRFIKEIENMVPDNTNETQNNCTNKPTNDRQNASLYETPIETNTDCGAFEKKEECDDDKIQSEGENSAGSSGDSMYSMEGFKVPRVPTLGATAAGPHVEDTVDDTPVLPHDDIVDDTVTTAGDPHEDQYNIDTPAGN